MNDLSDAQLIEKAKAGDEDALDVFLDRHRKDLLYYLWAETCNKEAAENLTQETLVKFYRKYRNIKENESARTYLFRIAYRNFLDWTKKEARRRGLAEMVPILNSAEAEIYEGICEEDL